tara:strand:+ start:974 stop:1486 length:513 start_codon:yes stop_codon:yes gene_type:complete
MLSKIKNTFLIILFFLASTYCLATNEIPNMLYGKVVRVVDGDTIHINNKNLGIIKIRLAEIDTPELDQPFGLEAKNGLKKLVGNKIVKIKKVTVDRYKRIVAIIYINDIEINYYLVKNGYAWCYEYYNQREKIKNAEIIAKKKKIGLWGKENFKPIPPWEWRKNKRLKNE